MEYKHVLEGQEEGHQLTCSKSRAVHTGIIALDCSVVGILVGYLAKLLLTSFVL